MNLGFFASGRGSNLQAILDGCADGTIQAKPAVLIVNNSKAPVADRARAAGVAVAHMSSVTHPDADQLDKAICATLREHEVELIALCGYMKKLGPQTLQAFANRIINVHPALLPQFGGPGMYGMNVHNAVIASGAKETGVSVHIVDGEYDEGPVIAQSRVPVFEGDTAADVAARVLPEEHKLYVETIRRIASGEISLPAR